MGWDDWMRFTKANVYNRGGFEEGGYGELVELALFGSSLRFLSLVCD